MLDSPFGVLDFLPWDHPWNGHHYAGEKLKRTAALMRAAGVSTVRMDFLWEDVEPARDTFCFDKYDRIIDLLQENGIAVLGVLNYSPSWLFPQWNHPPEPGLYARYAARVAARYKGRVRHWEIWNEPDHE